MWKVSLAFVVLLLLCNQSRGFKATWDYDLKSLEVFTTDESKMNIAGSIIDSKTFDAYGEWNYDTLETDMVELNVYRSKSGKGDDWEPLAFSIPKITLKKGLKKYYDVAYNNVAHCSNLPAPTEELNPFPKNIYKLDKCQISGYKLPSIAPSGYYKIELKFSSGDFGWGFAATSVIKRKSKM